MAGDEILTIRNVEALVNIGEMTAYSLARADELPGFKARRQWRFGHREIDVWIEHQVLSQPNDGGNQ